jgi:hypothetical protein
VKLSRLHPKQSFENPLIHLSSPCIEIGCQNRKSGLFDLMSRNSLNHSYQPDYPKRLSQIAKRPYALARIGFYAGICFNLTQGRFPLATVPKMQQADC